MREFDPISEALRPGQEEQRRIPDKNRYQGTMLIQRGQKVWKCSLKDRSITEAEIKETFDWTGKVKERKVMVEKDFIYVYAINRKNAWKKFKLELYKLVKHVQNAAKIHAAGKLPGDSTGKEEGYDGRGVDNPGESTERDRPGDSSSEISTDNPAS
jgi:hypothetical protein